jgi:hypothetical protein
VDAAPVSGNARPFFSGAVFRAPTPAVPNRTGGEGAGLATAAGATLAPGETRMPAAIVLYVLAGVLPAACLRLPGHSGIAAGAGGPPAP